MYKKVTDPKSLNGILNTAAFYNLTVEAWLFPTYTHTYTLTRPTHTTNYADGRRLKQQSSETLFLPDHSPGADVFIWMTTHLESPNYEQLLLICVRQHQPQINDIKNISLHT